MRLRVLTPLLFILAAHPTLGSSESCQSLLETFNRATGFERVVLADRNPRRELSFLAHLTPDHYLKLKYAQYLLWHRGQPWRSLRFRVKTDETPLDSSGRYKFEAVHFPSLHAATVFHPPGMEWSLGAVLSRVHELEHEFHDAVTQSHPPETRSTIREVLALQAEFYFARWVRPEAREHYLNILESDRRFASTRVHELYLDLINEPFIEVASPALRARGYLEEADLWQDWLRQ